MKSVKGFVVARQRAECEHKAHSSLSDSSYRNLWAKIDEETYDKVFDKFYHNVLVQIWEQINEIC